MGRSRRPEYRSRHRPRRAAADTLHHHTLQRVTGAIGWPGLHEKAFNCQPGQPMAPLKRCRVW
jgi:hypothetical protein